MANDTIASGGSFTLMQPLTGGTNIDFLNNNGNSGTLILSPTALRVTTVTSGGITSVSSATIGGTIENFKPSANFLPGDQITLQNIGSFYNELDFAADKAAQNAGFAEDANYAALSGNKMFISPDGSVSTSVDTPFTLSANSAQILGEIRSGLFGSAGSDATLELSFTMRTNPNSNHPFIDGVISTMAPINPCFCAGTRILTVRGEVAVEALQPGDRVVTLNGEDRDILWVGTRNIDISRHPRPESVQPMIIEPDALGDGVPSRRLKLSPDHALYIDGVLVQAKDLENRTTIRQDTAAARVHYYHVELATHDVLIADGAPAESYLDTGHRGVFDNAEAPLQLHPELMQIRREAEGCAPLCLGGEDLAAIRLKLARRQTVYPVLRAG